MITIPKGTLFGVKKITSDPCLERRLRIRAQWDLSSQTYNGQATTGQGEGVGCGLGLKYALIVAVVVS